MRAVKKLIIFVFSFCAQYVDKDRFMNYIQIPLWQYTVTVFHSRVPVQFDPLHTHDNEGLHGRQWKAGKATAKTLRRHLLSFRRAGTAEHLASVAWPSVKVIQESFKSCLGCCMKNYDSALLDYSFSFITIKTFDIKYN